jgi:catechol 2,3-dioxygenase-like lactoylglutathione lyase family enzyme
VAEVAIDYRPSHFGICVSDLERSLHFFCAGLGFEVGQRLAFGSDRILELAQGLEVEDGPVSLVCQFVRRGEMLIELLHYEFPAPTGKPSGSRGQLGFTHLSFRVDDVDAAIAHLVAHGARVIEQTRHDSGADLLFLADPDGVRVELYGPPTGETE